MKTTTAYSFDPTTLEFLGETVADESPLEPDVYLFPANTTPIQPPAEVEGKARVFRGEDWSYVPDWRGYVYWLEDGSKHEITELEIEPPADALDEEPPKPAVIPSVVTMRQARLALLGAGMLQGVNDSIAAMAGAEGDAARIEWEYAQTVERSSALVQSLSATLPLTEEQLDDLFTTAASL